MPPSPLEQSCCSVSRWRRWGSWSSARTSPRRCRWAPPRTWTASHDGPSGPVQHKNMLSPSHKLLTYVKYRAVSGVFQYIDPPLPSPPNECAQCVLPMDEGRERDKTSRGGGLPTLPGLYLSTIQPSQRGFFWVHMCVWRERKPEAEFLNFLGSQPSIPRNWFLKGTVALDGFFQCCGTGT